MNLILGPIKETNWMIIILLKALPWEETNAWWKIIRSHALASIQIWMQIFSHWMSNFSSSVHIFIIITADIEIMWETFSLYKYAFRSIVSFFLKSIEGEEWQHVKQCSCKRQMSGIHIYIAWTGIATGKKNERKREWKKIAQREKCNVIRFQVVCSRHKKVLKSIQK